MAVDLKQVIASRPLKVWCWMGATALAGILALALIIHLLFSGHYARQTALRDGQRVTLSLATGEMQGEMRSRPTSSETLPAILETDPLPEDESPTSSPPLPSTDVEKAETPTPSVRVELAPAPAEGLAEDSEQGKLPIISSNGTLPWEHYARPFAVPANGNAPLIALVVAGLGHSQSATEQAIKLPEAISLTFSPYAQNAEEWVKIARAEGHEVFIDLPLEPLDYPLSDPGPNALLTSLSPQENLKRLHWTLSRFAGYVGVFHAGNEKFSANEGAVKPILEELARRGVALLYTRTDDGVLDALVRQDILHGIAIDRMADSELSPESMERQLAELEMTARARGFAVGTIHPYPASLDRIALWAEGLSKKGITLAPVSAILKMSR